MNDAAGDEAAVGVLVVSADEDAAGFLAALLGREGYDTITSGRDRAAATIVAADPPLGLVVVDNDAEAVRSIRLLADTDLARVPIAVLGATDAAADDDGGEAAANAAGADVWIARPVDDQDLLAALRGVLA